MMCAYGMCACLVVRFDCVCVCCGLVCCGPAVLIFWCVWCFVLRVVVACCVLCLCLLGCVCVFVLFRL